MSKALQELTETIQPLKSKKEMESKIDPTDTWDILKSIKKSLDKQFETENSLIRLGDKDNHPLPSISTGLMTLDWDVIGCGGLAEGRQIEIFGPESSGKTSLALHCIAQKQKLGKLCAIVDSEHSLSPEYAKILGVDLDSLIFAQPDSGEQSVTTVQELVNSGIVSLIVVDSVAALVPSSELEGDIGGSFMGQQARLMSQSMRVLRGTCNVHKCTIIWINQTRMKIGVVYGNPETTTGGMALRFYTSLRLHVKRKEAIKDGDVQIGHQINIKAVKNKCGAPFRDTTVDLLYDSGIDCLSDTIQYAVNHGIIARSGSWFALGDEKLGQGLENVKQALLDDPTLLASIQNKIKESLDKPQSV